MFGTIVATASTFVAVLIRGKKPKVKGGQQIHLNIETAAQWCDYYGVNAQDGIVTLFKAIDDDYSTPYARAASIFYRPGAVPIAPDWDGGERECGGGLHFSPSPSMALEFNGGAKRFAACPVKLADIAIHPDGNYPQKVKARGCCADVWEVDRFGRRIEVQAPAVVSNNEVGA